MRPRSVDVDELDAPRSTLEFLDEHEPPAWRVVLVLDVPRRQWRPFLGPQARLERPERYLDLAVEVDDLGEVLGHSGVVLLAVGSAWLRRGKHDDARLGPVDAG